MVMDGGFAMGAKVRTLSLAIRILTRLENLISATLLDGLYQRYH